jgi:hypothetical protein
VVSEEEVVEPFDVMPSVWPIVESGPSPANEPAASRPPANSTAHANVELRHARRTVDTFLLMKNSPLDRTAVVSPAEMRAAPVS